MFFTSLSNFDFYFPFFCWPLPLSHSLLHTLLLGPAWVNAPSCLVSSSGPSQVCDNTHFTSGGIMTYTTVSLCTVNSGVCKQPPPVMKRAGWVGIEDQELAIHSDKLIPIHAQKSKFFDVLITI